MEVNPLKEKRSGAIVEDEVWYADGEVAAYNLAYINLKRCGVDYGRVLGYDNSHGFHHRHFMGKVETIKFRS